MQNLLQGSDDSSRIVLGLTSLALGYIAWTQIIPAVFAWLVASLFLAALVLVDMDARGANPADGLMALGEKFPLLRDEVGPWIVEKIEPALLEASDPDTGAIDLSQLDFLGFASGLWLALSLIGLLLGIVLGIIRGPRPPWRLGTKIAINAGACVLLVALCLGVFAAGNLNYEGTMLEWIMTFASFGIIVFTVTCWSILWAHGIGLLMRKIQSSNLEIT